MPLSPIFARKIHYCIITCSRMDPFSLATGIAGLAGLVASTVKLVRDYTSSVKNAQLSITTLLTELEALHSNLLNLDGFLHTVSVKDLVFQQTSVLCCSMSTCEVKLTLLHKKIQQASKSSTR